MAADIEAIQTAHPRAEMLRYSRFHHPQARIVNSRDLRRNDRRGAEAIPRSNYRPRAEFLDAALNRLTRHYMLTGTVSVKTDSARLIPLTRRRSSSFGRTPVHLKSP